MDDEGGGVQDPFRGLDFGAVDWARLTHAYGSAGDVPDLLRALASADAESSAAALDELIGSIDHQGTVYPASAPAVPFLVRAALHAPGRRAVIVTLIAAMCRAYGEDWTDPATFSGAVRAEVARLLPEILPLLNDREADVRRAALRIFALCPPQAVRTLVDLRTFADEDEVVRAEALIALARVERGWPGLRARLDGALADDSSATRQAAALTLMALDGLPYPRRLVDVLARSLADIGDLDTVFGGGLWDPLPNAAQMPCDIADEGEDSAALGRPADAALPTLECDPEAALDAAALIVAAGTRHAVLGAYLVDEVTSAWRDKQEAAARILALFLSSCSDIEYPTAHLLRLARCATRIEHPDPGLAAAARPWAHSEETRVADSAVVALARLREPDCLDLLDRSLARPGGSAGALRTVCEVFGERAAVLLPRLRHRLRSGDTKAVSEVARAVPHLGEAALETLPDLLVPLEAGIAPGQVLRALEQLGPQLRGVAEGRDVAAAAILAAAAGCATPFDRIDFAVAHRVITGLDTFAEQVAVELADEPRWQNHTTGHVARLGAAATACLPRVEAGLDSTDAWAAVRAAQAYWRISGEISRSAEVLCRHVSAKPIGREALGALLAMRHRPEQRLGTLHYLAHAPQRVLHDGSADGTPHDDDILRETARALLALGPNGTA